MNAVSTTKKMIRKEPEEDNHEKISVTHKGPSKKKNILNISNKKQGKQQNKHE